MRPWPTSQVLALPPRPAHPLAGRRVVVLAGPTAVGKSALALRLCALLDGELISVDSVQVQRNLQIGALPCP